MEPPSATNSEPVEKDDSSDSEEQDEVRDLVGGGLAGDGAVGERRVVDGREHLGRDAAGVD